MQRDAPKIFQSTNLVDLPYEILFMCFDQLGSPRDLISLSKTNKRLRSITFDKELWRKFNYLNYYSTPIEVVLYQHGVGVHMVHCQDGEIFSVCHKMVVKHYDFKRVKAITVSQLDLCKKMRTIIMAFFSVNLLAESHYHTDRIKIWNYKNGVCIHTLIEKFTMVSALATFGNNLLLSAHGTSPMRLWDISSGELTKSIKTQNYNIFRAKFISQNRCITICMPPKNSNTNQNNRTRWLFLWDIDQELILKKIRYDSVGRAITILPEENHIIVADSDGNICVYDNQLNNKLQELNTNQRQIICIEPLNAGIIALGTVSGKIQIWDLKRAKCIHSFMNDEQETINSIARLNDNSFISGGRDTKIRFWKFKITPEDLLSNINQYTNKEKINENVNSNQTKKHCMLS